MLSYMVPVEEKPPPIPKGILALELREGSPESKKVRTNISKESSTSSFASDLTVSSATPTGPYEKPRHKLLGNGGKNGNLKRVSFGSSKGSMVETLIFESPLQEEPEISPPPPTIQETEFPIIPSADDELERSKVRVSFYQGARPQCLSPPPQAQENEALYEVLLAAANEQDMTEHNMYNRQISTESGWDNPFRPDGDLSREADEIVSLIKGGKPITPTPSGQPMITEEVDSAHANILNASPEKKASSPLTESTPKSLNGTKNGGAVTELRPGQVEVQRTLPQEPQQPEHVIIKKKTKCNCCVIQ